MTTRVVEAKEKISKMTISEDFIANAKNQAFQIYLRKQIAQHEDNIVNADANMLDLKDNIDKMLSLTQNELSTLFVKYMERWMAITLLANAARRR